MTFHRAFTKNASGIIKALVSEVSISPYPNPDKVDYTTSAWILGGQWLLFNSHNPQPCREAALQWLRRRRFASLPWL